MKRLLLCLLATALTSACSPPDSPPLVATDIVINQPVPGARMAAGYLTLTNYSDQPVVITGASSPDFGKVEIHETRIEDGISRMAALESVTIDAGQAVRFEPGGKHLMLMRPISTDTAVTLQLYSGDTAVLTISTGGSDEGM